MLLDLGMPGILRQVAPLIGILLHVVEFLTAVLVLYVSPIPIHDSVGSGEHVGQVDITIPGPGRFGEGGGDG